MGTGNKKLIEEVEQDFRDGFDCSHVAFSHAAKKLGYDESTAKKIASCFGGGFFNGERCGAVTGAMMGLGLKYGWDKKEDKPVKFKELMEKKAKFEKRFKEKYGTVICSEIIGAKFPEDMQRIKDENLTKGCAALTAYACEILDELL